MALGNWWHELNTWEPETALTFYRRTLGWRFDEKPLPGGAGYWIAHRDGQPVGAIFELTAPVYAGIPSHWMTYMEVQDISVAERNTQQAGGTVLRPASEIPGIGTISVVTDSTGALLGLIEPVASYALA